VLEVFLTVDVEIWCDGWNDLDNKFPEAFRRYVYGPTNHGKFGLPYQVDVLSSHGLTGVFFVEPLFSTRFGPEPLAEIVGILNAANQEVQLHLHTEWVDESLRPLLENVDKKRQHLRYFSLEEQTTLINIGAKLLFEAGAAPVNAFRAGSFAFNKDTLNALAVNGIKFDSSYNASMFGRDSGVLPGMLALDPFFCDGVYEYPMTVFHDGSGSLRHAQISACSYQELEGLLWSALEAGNKAFVFLLHNFELMNQKKDRPDWVAIRRFERLCTFLDNNRDCFSVKGFHGLTPQITVGPHKPLTSPRWKALSRAVEQLYRKFYQ
jgi:hypothetical protein